MGQGLQACQLWPCWLPMLRLLLLLPEQCLGVWQPLPRRQPWRKPPADLPLRLLAPRMGCEKSSPLIYASGSSKASRPDAASALSATNTSRMLLRKAVPRADHLGAGRKEGNAGPRPSAVASMC
jgi:hypothetical protein